MIRLNYPQPGANGLIMEMSLYCHLAKQIEGGRDTSVFSASVRLISVNDSARKPIQKCCPSRNHKEAEMSGDGDRNGKKSASEDAEIPAEQDTPRAKEAGLEAGKPSLTGMIGMHIDPPDENVTTGSPNADIDRDLAED